MTAETNVLIQLRISNEAHQRMEAARAGLHRTIAQVDKGAFVTAAINHYTQYLANELNNGRDWLDGETTIDNDLLRTLDNTRVTYRPTADWVRLDAKRQPTDIELHRQLGGVTMAVAKLRTDRRDGDGKKPWGYRKLLRAAGFELDPDREEYTNDGYFFLPIRYRRRQED